MNIHDAPMRDRALRLAITLRVVEVWPETNSAVISLGMGIYLVCAPTYELSWHLR